MAFALSPSCSAASAEIEARLGQVGLGRLRPFESGARLGGHDAAGGGGQRFAVIGAHRGVLPNEAQSFAQRP